MSAAYLGAPGYLGELQYELRQAGVSILRRHGDLLVTGAPPVASMWAANVWVDAREMRIASIGDAAAQLRGLQRNWACYPLEHRGRAKLIAERLPHVSAKPLAIGAFAPAAPLGSWTLLEPNLVLAAPACTSPFPNGVAALVENRGGPPSRAYLKLWEALLRVGRWPAAGDRCLDLGASPGGWTWLLAQSGAQVTAVDKAPLDPLVQRLGNVRWLELSAFALDPAAVGPVDWLCSDIISYPRRLVPLLERWVGSGLVGNVVCTVKLQGDTDHESIARLAAIEGATLTHLSQNKHELTFLWSSRAGGRARPPT